MDSIEQILAIFEQVSAIPRATKHEQMISRWLQDWAKGHSLGFQTDKADNLLIRVPASSGLEHAPLVVLQGHMDMVCEKTPDSHHDFDKDPIHLIREGDWLRADQTTLGADNGIAIAIGLALAESRGVPHPPLELLLTVQEEEVGIRGATGLDPALVTGKILINLDSEKEGELIVGCAGGNTTRVHLRVSRVELAAGQELLTLRLDGLRGGHSGAEIHEHRANANKVLARALDWIQQGIPIQLSSLNGGTAHNAIPRSAEARFGCPSSLVTACRDRLSRFEAAVHGEYATTDQGLRFRLASEPAAGPHRVVPAEETTKLIQLLLALPDGVAEMSAHVQGLVETSNNLAVMELAQDTFVVTTSQRSTIMSKLEELTRRIEAVASLDGGRVERSGAYPAWQPNMDSPLLKRSAEVYEALFHELPRIKIVHAGLECGVIAERCGGMDAISLGPTVRNAHSPAETLNIPSVARTWDFLRELLARLAD